MGLTNQATGFRTLRENFLPARTGGYLVALAGNPNAGKSTIFNVLTGLRQHTGNWPGKTVLQARGKFTHQGHIFTLVDLPGTYSLLANSVEEQVARDFICFGRPDVTVVVVDATCLERNLNLVLQVTETTTAVVVCLNLMDEARRKNIVIDVPLLAGELGVPVVPTAARNGEGLARLKDVIAAVATGAMRPVPTPIIYDKDIETAASQLARQLQPLLRGRLNARWVALRLLEGDATLLQGIQQFLGVDLSEPGIKLQVKEVLA
ncbi:Ferrous iron transport protein B, N-terminal [Moorella glycerini]|uniref:Ferrous iron transport protein B n=1 Tax=Neomoorella stamsii TaxID=1266720 RepID=A0A9X7J3G6_9FIRM|nr:MULTISPECIES: FeoB small GTPase domain-containing protein [Moorella]PRR72819.1 Ferrous iron transport protein B [Moorella stamsii]CEP66244.1 Ferrous iron transport protein B, N-terminal [Moorella glycerini]CEP68164.1 Ferrous iron transport protein B, N-terminal [Moorella glycerini]